MLCGLNIVFAMSPMILSNEASDCDALTGLVNQLIIGYGQIPACLSRAYRRIRTRVTNVQLQRPIARLTC